jgi:alpha-L-fucosidase
MRSIILSYFILLCAVSTAQKNDAVPKPTRAQLAWHDMEFYLFMHFGPNTFTDLEWGHGTEKAETFSPDSLDCEQWCRIARSSGAKGIIITAKHHDGFCLWPSKYSTHTVRESKWKDGKGDVLKELSKACKKYGLRFGVYISPWDRNHPDYGTEKYNDVFVNMMTEIFKNYGPIWELWWDGANGEGPNGKKQVYDWKRFEKTVRKLSPQTVIFSDIGPDVRWCGNENGIAGKTNWNTLDTAGFTRGAGSPALDTLNCGNEDGKNWIPAECDVSIRPGWFYHKAEDSKVKSAQQLFDLYIKSVGRGANLLLNVPPDGRGLITAHDSAALAGLEELRSENFRNNISRIGKAYYVIQNGRRSAGRLNDRNLYSSESVSPPEMMTIGIEFDDPHLVNCIVLKEDISNGQNCKAFRLQLFNNKHEVLKEITGTTIGNKRIITFPELNVTSITLVITSQKWKTSISEIEAYLIDEKLIEK